MSEEKPNNDLGLVIRARWLLKAHDTGDETVRRLLEAHGRFQDGRDLPTRWNDYRAKNPRACYSASLAGLMRFPAELTYTEGVAVSRSDPQLTVVHAWLTDTEGGVVDLGWHGPPTAERGVAYLGVHIPSDVVYEATTKSPTDETDSYPVLPRLRSLLLDDPDLLAAANR